MSKNYMPEVAKMLGVELGEEFEVEGITELKCALSKDGLFVTNADRDYSHSVLLKDVLVGDKEIVRRPWRPKRGEKFWFIDIPRDESYLVDWCTYVGGSFDIHYILMGNCFPSREAAEAAAPEIVRFYEDVRKMVEEE